MIIENNAKTRKCCAYPKNCRKDANQLVVDVDQHVFSLSMNKMQNKHMFNLKNHKNTGKTKVGKTKVARMEDKRKWNEWCGVARWRAE